MKPDQYPTTHAIAKRLLEGPDNIAILAMPMFDMPGGMDALPVDFREQEIQGRKCTVFIPAHDDEAK